MAKLTALELGERLLSPLVSFTARAMEQMARDVHAELARAFPDLDLEETLELRQPARQACRGCRSRMAAEAARRDAGRGARAAAAGAASGWCSWVGPTWSFDPALNLGLPRKLEELGAEVYWQEELDLEGFQPAYARQVPGAHALALRQADPQGRRDCRGHAEDCTPSS